MFEQSLLSIVIWLPILGGLSILGINNKCYMKKAALFFSVITFIATVYLYCSFDAMAVSDQFVENYHWIDFFKIHYALGADGIGVALVLLTSFCTIIVVISAWNTIKERISHYYASFLVMSGLMNGVFLAQDAILFYIFWEAMLIPMFLIIGIWGSENRIYAAIKFFLYTFLGSILMLVGLVYLYTQTGSFLFADWHDLHLSHFVQNLLFLAFFAAFAVKIPMWPVHTWLPDAHVQAPTEGSVVLAAVMLKLGAFGFLRLCLPILPNACDYFANFMIFLSLVAIIYIGFIAIVQQNLKKLIAYSSIAHMGFVTLGIFGVYPIFHNNGSLDAAALGMEGAFVQMLSHGLISAGLFLCVGVLYERLHTKQIADFGGVVNSMPVFASLFMVLAMANSGLPGTSGFIGEFMVILSSIYISFKVAMLAGVSLIIGAAYTLWMYKRTIFGQINNEKIAVLKDLGCNEFIVLSSLCFSVIFFGIYPKPLTDLMHQSTLHIINLATHFS